MENASTWEVRAEDDDVWQELEKCFIERGSLEFGRLPATSRKERGALREEMCCCFGRSSHISPRSFRIRISPTRESESVPVTVLVSRISKVWSSRSFLRLSDAKGTVRRWACYIMYMRMLAWGYSLPPLKLPESTC